jgi:hypothetical protein
VTFTYTGGEQTYTVPAGVTSLQVQAVAANGGAPAGAIGNPGGTGGMVIGELSVGAGSAIKPGETLYVAVGGAPRGTNGGFNGGGDGATGGSGGGGATDVRTCSAASASCANGVSSPLTRLIVAAGGGGAGACVGENDNCGAGGSAGQPGGDPPAITGAGLGGGAGTVVAPGGPGAPFASSPRPPKPGGVDGTGGHGGFTTPGGGAPGGGGGGGGGAGYFGGGGGGVADGDVGYQDLQMGGGGGGGANFASPFAVSGVSFAAGDATARLLITPRPPSAVRISRIYYNSPGPDTATNESLNAEFVRIKNTSRTVRQLRGWSISDSDGHAYRFGRLRLRAGGSITVHSGRGRDTRKDRYWNRRGYVWDNARELVRVHNAHGRLADQCRYDNSRAGQLRC